MFETLDPTDPIAFQHARQKLGLEHADLPLDLLVRAASHEGAVDQLAAALEPRLADLSTVTPEVACVLPALRDTCVEYLELHDSFLASPEEVAWLATHAGLAPGLILELSSRSRAEVARLLAQVDRLRP